MGKLTFDMSISLDGLIAGPGDHVERREPLARMAARRSPSSATGSRARSRRPGRPPATPTSRSRAANVIQQDLQAGLVDEFQLHFVPVVLGGGVRLFDRPVELERTRVIDSPGVTHMRFRVGR